MHFAGDVISDVKYALRGLRKNRGFAVASIVTLALGIGANTAVFSILYGVWLAPARYHDPDRLVQIHMRQTTGHRFEQGVSAATVRDWQAQSKSMSAIGMHRYVRQMNVTGREGAEEIVAHRISAGLLDVLGVRPMLGSGMDATADRAAGPRQALLSAAWWQRRFGGDPNVVGKRLELDGEAYTIAGVMPDGFQFPPLSAEQYRPVAWVSLNLSDALEQNRGSKALYAIARTVSNAEAAVGELEAITSGLAQGYPDAYRDLQIVVRKLNEGRELDQVRPALLLAMGAALLVLLIAAANIANLLLARSAGREREILIRRALGVTWWRLTRQLLTESAVLTCVGGLAGVTLAYLALPLLRPLLPANMPRADEVGVNAMVLAFSFAVSAVTGLLFSLLPLLRVGSGTAVGGRSRVTKILVLAESGLAVMLVACAGLLLTSFSNASGIDPGFDASGDTLAMRIPLAQARYPDAQRIRAFREELLRRVESLPGVQVAGTVSSLPMGILAQGVEFMLEGRPETAGTGAHLSNVSPNYMRAMRIPLVAGRYFSADDTPASGAVTIVSEGLARRFWPASPAAALGERIRFHGVSFAIVGVVRDVRQFAPDRLAEEQVYALNDQLPLELQGGDMGRFNVLVVRGVGLQGAGLRRIVDEIDPDQPVAALSSLRQIFDTHLQPRRLNTVIASLFAGLALLLAGSGVYGMVSHTVERRTREFGIRIAVGATPRGTLLRLSGEMCGVVALGAAVGLAGVAGLSRWIESFLYGVPRFDPLVLILSVAGLLGVALVSTVAAGHRVMSIDPMEALRAES